MASVVIGIEIINYDDLMAGCYVIIEAGFLLNLTRPLVGEWLDRYLHDNIEVMEV